MCADYAFTAISQSLSEETNRFVNAVIIAGSYDACPEEPAAGGELLGSARLDSSARYGRNPAAPRETCPSQRSAQHRAHPANNSR